MKVKVSKKSKTGVKLIELFDRMNDAYQDQKRIAKEIGFVQWRGDKSCLAGGFSTLIFKDLSKSDRRNYRKVHGYEGEFMPSVRTKKGRSIQKILDECKRVKDHEIGDILGINFEFGHRFFQQQDTIYLDMRDKYIKEVNINSDIQVIAADEFLKAKDMLAKK